MGKPLLIASSAASAAFGYVAYVLYTTPTLLVPLASITMSPDSFFPHTESTELVIGGGWEYYAGAAAALATVIPWHIFGVGRVEKRLEAAGRSAALTDKRGLQTTAVNEAEVKEDLHRKKQGVIVSGGLALLGLGLAGYGQAWW